MQFEQDILRLASTPNDTLFELFDSSINGLQHEVADQQREKVGLNLIPKDQKQRWWHKLWESFYTPFNLLLTGLSLTSYITDDLESTIVIGSMVLIATLMGFYQEMRSKIAIDALNQLITRQVTIIRPTGVQRVSAEILVPGDLIELLAGDIVPADVRIVTSHNLLVNQSSMTGESEPVMKSETISDREEENLFEMNTLAFMGSHVIAGSAKAIVIKTGEKTWLGNLAQTIVAHEGTQTAFQLGVNKVSWLLIRFMMVMTPIVFFINGVSKGEWWDAFLFAISIAVGLTPEMLPMIVTSSLARGAVAMAKSRVIVRRLDAIQNFGAMDILCTDKTGTLTENELSIVQSIDSRGEQDDAVFNLAVINSQLQTGFRNPLDTAILAHAQKKGLLAETQAIIKFDEFPFDFYRKRITVVIKDEEKFKFIVKGAVEEMLASVTSIANGDRIEHVSVDAIQQIRARCQAYHQQGYRLIAIATRTFNRSEMTRKFTANDERQLVLQGFLIFNDPPKDSAKDALQALQHAGVQVKILTGDDEYVTAAICQALGVKVEGRLTSHEIESMDDDELGARVNETQVFAKLTPLDKERIVTALKRNNHVVGFLGDGINDAAALRVADVGISVDSAADIARESADMLLLDKDLMVLERGLCEGRRTFANMLKYLKMTVSSNFGNVFSVMIASLFIPFMPMLPLQLLLQNMLYDISQLVIPFDKVDKELLNRPLKWNPAEISRYMLIFGPTSSVFDVITFIVLWFVFHANNVDHAAMFQSGWFVEGLLSQTLVVHLLRTQKIPFIQSVAALPLLIMTGVIVLIGLLLPLSPFATHFGLVQLPNSYYAWLFAILLGYGVLTQLVKVWFSRTCQQQ